MSNIYGESSSQSFNKVELLKAHYQLNRRSAKVRYVDDSPNIQVPIPQPVVNSNSYSLSGGRKKIGRFSGSGDQIPIVVSPEYVNDSELKDFIQSFHLHYTCTNMRLNGIIVVPPKSVLTKLKEDFYAKLKSNNISDTNSTEASIFASKTDTLLFKNYIFDIYGEKGSNNEGFDYKLDPAFPSMSGNVVLRRTNRMNNVYYFECDTNVCKIANNPKMTKSVNLELIGKCDHQVFIFKGEIPEPSEESKSSNVATAISGGDKNSSGLRQYFSRLLAKYDGDIYAAADEFIPKVLLAEISRTGDVAKSSKKVANYCSADLVHSAMSILFADEGNDFSHLSGMDMETFDPTDTNSAIDSLLNNYTPKSKNINMQTATKAIDSLYAKSTTAVSPFDATKVLVHDVMKVYGKFPASMFKADVATSILTSNNVNDSTLNYAFAVADGIGTILSRNGFATNTNPIFKEQISVHSGVSSALTNAIHSAFSNRPFIGLSAKAGIPMFTKAKVYKRIMGNNKSKCSKGKCGNGKKKCGNNAFEEQNSLNLDNNEEYKFNLLDNEEEPVNESVQDPVAPDVDNDDEMNINSYGNDRKKKIDDIIVDEEQEIVDNNAPAEAENMLNAFLED